MLLSCFFFKAEDGIRNQVRSRGLGDVYKRQPQTLVNLLQIKLPPMVWVATIFGMSLFKLTPFMPCLLYTSDAADERSSVDLGGRRIIKKKNKV